MWEKNRIDFVKAKGAKTMNGTLDNSAMSDQGYPNNNLARIAITGHGLLAGSTILLPDIANDFDGLRTIRAVAANSIDIEHNDVVFTATTPAGTELWYVGQTYDSDWELVGYKVHLSAAGGTSENLTVDVDAAAGSQFDWNILTEDMNAVKDIVQIFEQPIPMEANDILKFNYANTNSRTWGVQILSRRLA